MSIISKLPKKFWWQNFMEKLKNTQPLSGAGTPAATVTNAKSIGQIYVDTTNSKAYIAKSVTATPASDWMILN